MERGTRDRTPGRLVVISMAILFTGMLFCLAGMAIFPAPASDILLDFGKAMFALWLPCLGCAIFTALTSDGAADAPDGQG